MCGEGEGTTTTTPAQVEIKHIYDTPTYFCDWILKGREGEGDEDRPLMMVCIGVIEEEVTKDD